MIRGLTTQVWPATYESRGTAKSKLLVGWMRPPEVMIGRYSTSCGRAPEQHLVRRQIW